MRVGIFGGSFNPVHSGHIFLAKHALAELNLDRVIFVPSFQTPLKDPKKLFPAEIRLACLKTAIKKEERFLVSDYEIRKKGVSYTVDTLKYFHRQLGQKTMLYFLAGADTAKNLSRWKSPDKVLKLCRFAVFSRPGVSLNGNRQELLTVPFPALDISSSGIRKKLWAGKTLNNLVPDGVENALKQYKRKVLFSSIRKRKSP